MSNRTSFCKYCGAEFDVKGKRGRPPKFCSPSCRQRAYVARKARQNESGIYAFLEAHGQSCTYCDNGLSVSHMWLDLRTLKPYCSDCYRQLQEETLHSQLG